MQKNSIQIPLLINAEGRAIPLSIDEENAIEQMQYLQEMIKAKDSFISNPKKTTEISKLLNLNRSTLEKNIKKALSGNEKAKAKLEDYYDLYIFREFLRINYESKKE